jgi:hypothetical protein
VRDLMGLIGIGSGYTRGAVGDMMEINGKW